LSLFYNKIYKTENTESSIILNKIRSLLGGSSEHGFREYRPCYIHGRTHVGISDVAKCGKGILAHKPNKIILFTVTSLTRDSSQNHFYKISKHLIDKPSSFTRKEMSSFCFSDDQYWGNFYVLIVSPSGIMIHLSIKRST